MVMTRSLGLVLSMLLTTAGGAGAQAGFDTPTVNLGSLAATGGGIRAPRVAVGASGNAVALFVDGPSGLGVIRASHYDAATKTWAAPATLATGFQIAHSLHVVLDQAGNATALWVEVRTFSVSSAIAYTARYIASSGAWEAPVAHSGPAAGSAALAGVPAGDGVLVWTEGTGGVSARRFLATSGTWQPAVTIAPGLTSTPSTVQVEMAGDGVAHALWGASTLQTAALDPGTNTWGAVATLWVPLLPGATPRVAVGPAGHAVATWAADGAIQASRYTPGGAGWSAAEVLHPGAAEAARAVIDGSGRITVAWIVTYGVRTTISRVVVVARFDGGTWTSETIPGQGTFAYSLPGMAVDAGGNVFLAWGSSRPGPGVRLGVTRRHASTGTWSPPSEVSEAGQSAFNSDVAVADTRDAVVVWFQTVSGISTTQARHWRATPPAPSVSGVTPSPGALDLVFGVAPSADPVLEPTTVEYSLDDGATWTTRSPAGLTGPLTVSGLVDGQTYLLRLRVVNAAGTGTASPPTAVRSGTGSAPTHFRVAARSGQTLTFAWVAPPAGFVPTGYLLEGGFTGTSTVLAAIPTAGPATQFTITLPAGAYFTRIVAIAGPWLRSPPSNEAAIAVGVLATPAAPAHLLASAHGSALALSWTNEFDAAAPTSLVLDVTGAITTALALPVSEAFTFAGVPPGTYTFAVRTMNGLQPGPAGNAVTLTFPGSCAATPNPPTAFSASAQGGRIFLDWLPPVSGEAVTHYVVSATGAFSGSFPLAARTFSAPVPPGSYTVRVAAVGPCGTSPTTTPQTVAVP